MLNLLSGKTRRDHNLFSDGCSKDTDCKGSRICENGICVNPESTILPNSSPIDLSPSEATTLFEMEREREIYLAKGRDNLVAAIVTHFLTGAAAGTGASIYLYTDQKILSYVIFSFGGIMAIASLSTLAASLHNYGEAKKIKQFIDKQQDPLYKKRRVSFNLPTPIIYKKGVHSFYGLSLGINF